MSWVKRATLLEPGRIEAPPPAPRDPPPPGLRFPQDPIRRTCSWAGRGPWHRALKRDIVRCEEGVG